ncbi:protein kinase domain-containing protein [Novipirellula sp. SH528]|uniref:serine/threonine-protein kinase n=1 Tax=Novipirellula sp. SH528 TaxID=3454466 RepID=UPI003F9F4ABA
MKTTQQVYDFLAPASQPDDLGMLGSYRVISELGKGGMGYVFRAEDTRLKRTVALKVMNKKIAATPNSRTRFVEEARAMAAVHHDNVVVIFEVGERSGTPFMAMELLKGQTLEALNLKKTQLGFEKILDFAKQIARGLAAAHAKEIVHRDIKPANIWIEEGNDRIKILDFGLALAQTPVDRLAGTGSVIGTPGYLSPEQARTDPLDDRSDLYSLGVVLYELCTGRLPLASSSVSGQLVAILSHKPKPIRELNPEIPAPLAELVQRLLAKEARERPSSARHLEEELQRIEVECHAKSEVALAINKLQLGLSEVVGKKQSDDIFGDSSIEVVAEDVPDPFAFPSMPVAPAAMPGPLAAPAPRGPMSAPAQRPVASKTPASAIDWKQYAPFIAIGVLALLLIVVAIFAFVGGGTSGPTTIAETPSVNSANSETPKRNQVSQPAKPPANPSANAAAKKDPPADKPKKGGGNRKNQNNKNRNDAKASEDSKPEKSSNPKPDKPKPSMVDVAAVKSNADLVSNAPASSDLPPDYDSMKNLQPASDATANPPASSIPVKTVAISSADGIGADSSVRRGAGGGDPMGTNQAMAIQTRNNAELEHAYMRFDLGVIGKERAKIQDTKLVLTLVGDELPSDSALRLYGVDTPAAERWQESGRFALTWNNSYSKHGLDSLPLLAEAVLTEKDNGEDRQITIGGEVLTEFLRSAKSRSVTLILAGGRADNSLLAFSARERDPAEAPKLVLELPTP